MQGKQLGRLSPTPGSPRAAGAVPAHSGKQLHRPVVCNSRQDFRFDPRHGKGSHGTLHLGDRHTTVPHKEIGAGLLASMLKSLNIPRKDF